MSWRFGVPSFIYPAGWLENVQRLGPRPHIQDIEILFFDIDGPGGLPSAAEMQGLRACKQQHGLTYTLHTPLRASLASAHAPRRAAGIDLVLRAMAAAAPLEPENYVLHVYLGDHEGDTPPTNLQAWTERAVDSLQRIAQDSGIPRHRLCVESLDYPMAHLTPVLQASGVSLALDVGHMWRDGIDPTPHIMTHAQRLRIVQFHGTQPNGRDHRGLQHCAPHQVPQLLRTLRAIRFAGVLTLEVFRPEDLPEQNAGADFAFHLQPAAPCPPD